MKYLFKKRISSYYNLLKEDIRAYNWEIQNKSIKERYEYVKKYSYFNVLKETADNNEIKYNDYEIISWLDSMSILYKCFQLLKDKILKNNRDDYLDIYSNITIIQEYNIPFTNKRPDYLLILNNQILIIEFSYSKIDNKDYQFQTKLNQVINYKELINNLLSDKINIGTYTFIIHPEDENKNANKKEIENFVDFLIYYFKNTRINALKALEEIK